MVTLANLWLPIVVATVGVFGASSLVHMLFKWHNSDYQKLPDEDAVRGVIGKLPAGQYTIPHCIDMKLMQAPEMRQKFTDGPVAMLMVRPRGMPNMGAHLGQWFGLCAMISVITAYMAAHTVPWGVSFLAVCRMTGGCAFLAHGAGAFTNAIWMGRPWRSAMKDVLDATIYATVTAVSFGAFWPGPTG